MLARPSALRAVSLALVTAQLGAFAHGALSRHVSADSGAVVDACPREHSLARAARAALAGRDEAAGHHHESRHCAALTFLRALERAEPVGLHAPALPQGHLAQPTQGPRRGGSGVAVLRLAPKASPPARSC